MTSIIILILIGVIIYLVVKNDKLSDELKRTKTIRFCRRCGFEIGKTYNTIENNNTLPKTLYNNKNMTIKHHQQVIQKNNHKKQYTESEIRNNLILVIGSILIILSSVIFLTSNWYDISELIKIIIVFLVLGVFLATSYIADKYLNLKQTSIAFFNIALTYIPIALFLIALFELFGKFLSLYGLGKYLYLTISSLIVTIIYYFCATKRKSNFLAISSFIFQFLTTIFFCLIFTNSFKIVTLCLLIHSSIFTIMYNKKIYYLNQSLHLKINNVLSISIIVLVALELLVSTITTYNKLIDITLGITLLLYLYILLVKTYSLKNIYHYFYPIITIITIYNISFLVANNFVTKQLFIILSTILIYVFNLIKYNKINIGTYITTTSVYIILYLVTSIYSVFSKNIIIESYIILLIFTLINYINYIYNEKHQKTMSYIFTINLLLSIYGIVNNFELISLVSLYITYILLIIGKFIKTINQNLRNAFINTGHIFIWLLIIIGISNSVLFILFLIIYTIYCYLSGYFQNNITSRIISYIFINIILSNILQLFELYNYNYIIALTSFIVFILERLTKYEKDNKFKIYAIIQFIISYLILIVPNSKISFLILIPLVGLFIYFIKLYKLNNKLIYIPIFSLIPYIYNSSILVYNTFNYMYFISISIIITSIYFIYTKKTNQYIIIFYVYTICHILSLEEIKYISLFLLLVGNSICYIIKINKTKDIYKGLIYTLLLILYKYIIKDLNLNNLSILNYGIYIVYLILINRTIIKKYQNNYKVFEYLFSILIYYIALINYSSELDGIIFVFFLSLIVIISYINKYGPLFLVSLITILMNVIILTRTFWLNIPWFIYILIVGSILVAFSIYNEIKLKKDNEIKNKLINLKKDLDI